MNFVRTFYVFVLCFVATLAQSRLSCVQNYVQESTVTIHAGDAVSQYVDGSYINDNVFSSASLDREDSVPISGTFFIVPGLSTNTGLAIFSTLFSSSSNVITVSGTVPITVGSSYTFLWVRDLTGDATNISLAGDWLVNSYFSTASAGQDFAGQLCVNHMNTVPTHCITTVTSTGTTGSVCDSTPRIAVSNNQGFFRSNQGSTGVRLGLSISDSDLVGSSDNITYGITLTVVSGTPTVWMDISPLSVYVEQTVNTPNYFLFNGPLSGMQSTINNIKVKWNYDTFVFRITINTTDHGAYGVCSDGSFPCELWTASYTNFRVATA